MQTFNDPLKNKDVQIFASKKNHAECMTNSWAIYDAYYSSEIKPSGENNMDFDIKLGMDITRGGLATSTTLTDASTDILNGNKSISRSIDIGSETVFSSVLGGFNNETSATQNDANSPIIEKDLSHVFFLFIA